MGVRLLMTHPNLPTCEDCKKWLFDREWNPVPKRGDPNDYEERPIALNGKPDTPCYSCPKIPMDKKQVASPEHAIELSDRNKRALWYAYQCEADDTHLLPRDLTVVRNNALVKLAKENLERDQNQQWLAMTLLMRKRDG